MTGPTEALSRHRIMADQEPTAGAGPRAPRAAAVVGIVFSLLLGLALVLINVSVPSNPATPGGWLTDGRTAPP